MPAVVVIRDNDLEQLFRARMVALQPQPLVMQTTRQLSLISHHHSDT